MDLKLSGKKALITGSTAGIGFAAAQHLLKEGVEVYLNGRHPENTLKAVEKLKAAVPQARVAPFVADLYKPAEVEKQLNAIS